MNRALKKHFGVPLMGTVNLCSGIVSALGKLSFSSGGQMSADIMELRDFLFLALHVRRFLKQLSIDSDLSHSEIKN
jgi:hypothetical protein